MNRFRLLCLLLAFTLSTTATAAARVLEVHYATPDEVAAAIRNLHGDSVRVEVVRQRLLLVGEEALLAEVAALVGELDQAPLPLRLTLSTQAPMIAGNGQHYQTGGNTLERGGAIEVSSIEGALITIDHSRFAQQAVSAGWIIELAETAVTVNTVTLQIQRRSDQLLDIVVGYTDYSSGQRRVFGNTVTTREDEWISLLPTAAAPAIAAESGTHYSTATQPRDQLWLRVEAVH